MKTLFILITLAASLNANAFFGCRGADCSNGTANVASHTLDVYMGGFKDGLYVCKIEIEGHECEGKYQDHNPAGDYLTILAKDKPFQTLVSSNGKTISFGKPDLSNDGYRHWLFTANHTLKHKKHFYSQVHLNSHRYGSKYSITYCYDWDRLTTEGDHGWDNLDGYGFDQFGKLTGALKVYVTDKHNVPSYWNDAQPKAQIAYSCMIDGMDVVYSGTTSESNLSHSLRKILYKTPIPLDYNTYGHCEFKFTFTEGRVGEIRDHNGLVSADSAVTKKSWLKTFVDVNMTLINYGSNH